MQIRHIIYILILGLLFGCTKNRTLSGNYCFCKYGGYVEIYFKGDSMRVASNDEWIKLSKWKKIEIKNDTLYFETFGEWRYSTKAKIKYLENSKVELCFLDSDKNLNLKPIDQNLKIENSEKFWNGFKNRFNIKNCN